MRPLRTSCGTFLKEDFVKAKAGYHITFEKPLDSIDNLPGDGWVSVKFQSWYDLRNLTGKLVNFPFVTTLLGDHRKTAVVDGKALEYPHFVSVEINDIEVPLTELQDEKDPLTLRGPIPLPKSMAEVTPVKVTVRQLYRTKDSVVCSSTLAMEQSEITVSNQVADLVGTTEAVVLHKHTEQVKPRNDGKWEFSRALIPGQGWYVYWESVDE